MDKEKFIEKVIENVKYLTGKIVEFKPMEFNVGLFIIIDGVSKGLTNSVLRDYNNTIDYYEIDIITDFSNMIIKEFNLKSNG
jgi:hypothetical protein